MQATRSLIPDSNGSKELDRAKTSGRTRRIVIRTLGSIVLVLFAIWLVLYITKGRFLKHPFERTVGALTHRSVSVTGDFQLYFDPIAIKFYAEGLRIANPSWATKTMLFAADRIDTRISPWSLIVGKRRLYWLELTNGVVDLEWNAAHTTNNRRSRSGDRRKAKYHRFR